VSRGEGNAGGGEGCGGGGRDGGGEGGVGVEGGAGRAGGEVEQERDADRHGRGISRRARAGEERSGACRIRRVVQRLSSTDNDGGGCRCGLLGLGWALGYIGQGRADGLRVELETISVLEKKLN
jgi:hypothetical protein